MKTRTRLKLYKDKQSGSDTYRYRIGLFYDHEMFNIYFMTSEPFTLPEATYRIIRMAVEMDAEIDGIIIANDLE